MIDYQDFVIKSGVVTGFKNLKSDVDIPQRIKDVSKVDISGPHISTLVIPGRVTGLYCYDIEFAECPNLETLVLPVALDFLDYSSLAFCKASTIVLLSKELTMRDGSIDSVDCVVVAPNLPLAKFRPADKPKAIQWFVQWYCSGAKMPESYKADYLKYIKSQRKKLWQDPLTLQVILKEGFISLKELPSLIDEAAKVGRPDLTAMLMNYQSENFNQAERTKEQNRQEKQSSRILEGTIPVSELKKIWKTKKLEDGTLALVGYKGKDAEIVIPEKIGRTPITEIASNAFERNQRLTAVVIPEGIRKIGSGAFWVCENLKSISIPNSMETLDSGAFRCCYHLTDITIPDSVTQIGSGAFCSCDDLADKDGFVIIRNVLYNYTGSSTHVAIPDGVTEISYSAFYGNKHMTDITIPESVTNIDSSAFGSCTGLTSIVIPQNVTEIGSEAFSRCTALTSITLPESVTEIDKRAFDGCPNLTIHAPAGSYAEQYTKKNNIPFEPI